MKKIYSIKDFPDKDMIYGKYVAHHPKAAARKAFSKLVSKLNLHKNLVNNSSKFLVFTIVDNNTNKLYKYIGKKIKLEKPIYVVKAGKQIKYEYSTIIGKYNSKLNSEF